jgi:outer membrane lipoprotein-sorting protein
MRFSGLAAFVTILAMGFGAGSLPAGAQMLPSDLLRPLPHGQEPATMESITQGFNLSAAPLPTSAFQPRVRPSEPIAMSEAEAEPDPILQRAKPAMAEQKPPPLPPHPVRPNVPKPETSEPIEIAPRPVVTASAGPEAVVKVEALSNREIVERANAYFTNLTTLVADFTQLGGDGRRQGGTLYLQRPGKVRFEYDPPATLQVIADGRSVAVRDRKLATQDLYSISQTPLKFLLRERVNLGQDIRITGITHDGSGVRVNLEDSSTLGGTSRITLFFDPQIENLSQWRIIDAQGFQTMVVLDKVERGRRIDQDLFKIQYETIIGSGNNR